MVSSSPIYYWYMNTAQIFYIFTVFYFIYVTYFLPFKYYTFHFQVYGAHQKDMPYKQVLPTMERLDKFSIGQSSVIYIVHCHLFQVLNLNFIFLSGIYKECGTKWKIMSHHNLPMKTWSFSLKENNFLFLHSEKKKCICTLHACYSN